MFGYVIINESELKIKDYRKYRGVYCGLCQTLKRRFGPVGQLGLNNDMTFAALLFMGLYEEIPGSEMDYRCKLHPTKKVRIYENACLDYAADMTMILAYYLARDHWIDDRNPTGLVQMKLLKKAVGKLADQYPRQFRAVRRYVRELETAEAFGEENLDILAGLTGTMFGELLNWKDDIWAEMLRGVGFYLGKFIYLMDAYEDLEKDISKGRFNPLAARRGDSDFENWIFGMLDLMMAECARHFEQLPITSDVEILRNILYAGVWSKYFKVRKDRNQSEDIKDESL